MEGAVGNHLHVAAPAVEGADDAPGTHLGIGGIRVFLPGYGNDDLRSTADRIQDEVVPAVLGDDDVSTALRHGEFLAQRIGTYALGITEILVPAGVLAELHLIAGGERDALRHMQGAVGPHFHVGIVAPTVEGAHQTPFALLGVAGIRIAARNEYLVFGDGDFALGVHVAVTAVVAGLLLHGSTDHDFQGDLFPFREAHGHELLGQVGRGDGQGSLLGGGGQGLADLPAVDGGQHQPVVQGHLPVEGVVENRGSVGGRHAVIRHLVPGKHRGGGLRRIEHGHFLLDAGGGSQGQDTCQYSQYLLHGNYYLVP